MRICSWNGIDVNFFDIEIQYIGTIVGLNLFRIFYNHLKIKEN